MAGRPPESIRHRGYEHAQRVYAELARRSIPTTDGARIFRGSLMALCRELGYTSSSQYAQLRNDLAAMGCIAQARKGTSQQPGLWVLHRPPSVELWHQHLPGRAFTRRTEAAQREAHARNLRAALERLPSTLPQVAGQLRDAGVRTIPGAITWLAASLTERQLRELGPSMCLAYATEGTPVAVPHSCGVEGLDDLVPSLAAGSWKRRQNALERLGAG